MPRLSNTYAATLAGAGDVMRVNASDYRTAVERAYARYGRPRVARIALVSYHARPGCGPYIRMAGTPVVRDLVRPDFGRCLDSGLGSELAPLGDDWMTGGFTPRNDYPQLDGGA